MPLATILAMASTTYQGKVRILDMNGILYDVGKADLSAEGEPPGWGGTIRLFENSALATKSITSLLELPDGRRLTAQVGPRCGDAEGETMLVSVVGIEDVDGF